MRSFGLREDNLLPTKVQVKSADSSSMNVLGTIIIEFKRPDVKKSTIQMVYICEGAQTNLLSYSACVELGFMTRDMCALQGEDIAAYST